MKQMLINGVAPLTSRCNPHKQSIAAPTPPSPAPQGMALFKYLFPPLVWLVDRTPFLRGHGLGMRLPSPLLRYITFKFSMVGWLLGSSCSWQTALLQWLLMCSAGSQGVCRVVICCSPLPHRTGCAQDLRHMPALQDLVAAFMRAMTGGDTSQWHTALQVRRAADWSHAPYACMREHAAVHLADGCKLWSRRQPLKALLRLPCRCRTTRPLPCPPSPCTAART